MLLPDGIVLFLATCDLKNTQVIATTTDDVLTITH